MALSEKRLEQIVALLQEGKVASLLELSTRTGYSKSRLVQDCSKYDILFPDHFQLGWRPEIDSLVQKGYSLGEIRKAVGGSKQNVFIYIKRSGQQRLWKEYRFKHEQQKRQERQQRATFQQFLFCWLEQYLQQRVAQEGWASQKALLYYRKYPQTRLSFQTLVELLQRYDTAKQQNQKVSLRELSAGLGLHGSTANNIILELGERALYWKSKCFPRQVYHKKKVALYRARRLPLPASDIAYFLEVNYIFAHRELHKINPRRCFSNRMKMFGGGGSTREVVRYQDASKIYEAQDAGLTIEEMQQYFGKSQHAITYALEQRPALEKVILATLRTLYPTEKITTPYRLRSTLSPRKE